MKKYLLSAFFLLILAGVFVALNPSTRAYALGFLIRSGANVSTGSLALTNCPSGTTTPKWLQVGLATSTLTFATDSIGPADATLLLQVNASSTNTQSPLNIHAQASDDAIDFFDYDLTVKNLLNTTSLAATSTITLASSTVDLQWMPSFHSTTTKAVSFQLMPARFTRLTFSLSTTTSPATQDSMNLCANVMLQEPTAR